MPRAEKEFDAQCEKLFIWLTNRALVLVVAVVCLAVLLGGLAVVRQLVVVAAHW